MSEFSKREDVVQVGPSVHYAIIIYKVKAKPKTVVNIRTYL